MDQAFSYRSPVATLISSNEMEITCDINVSFVSHTSISMTMTVDSYPRVREEKWMKAVREITKVESVQSN